MPGPIPPTRKEFLEEACNTGDINACLKLDSSLSLEEPTFFSIIFGFMVFTGALLFTFYLGWEWGKNIKPPWMAYLTALTAPLLIYYLFSDSLNVLGFLGYNWNDTNYFLFIIILFLISSLLGVFMRHRNDLIKKRHD